jgi:hypothetical protein
VRLGPPGDPERDREYWAGQQDDADDDTTSPARPGPMVVGPDRRNRLGD